MIHFVGTSVPVIHTSALCLALVCIANSPDFQLRSSSSPSGKKGTMAAEGKVVESEGEVKYTLVLLRHGQSEWNKSNRCVAYVERFPFVADAAVAASRVGLMWILRSRGRQKHTEGELCFETMATALTLRLRAY